jgi:hypothetical protein
VSRRIGFQVERFEYVPDGSSLAWGEAWSGPIRPGDRFWYVLPPSSDSPLALLHVASISGASGGQVDELRRGQKGTLALRGDAPPDIAAGATLMGEMEA